MSLEKFQYTYKDFCKLTGKSLPTLQAFVKELSTIDADFVNAHQTKCGKNGRFIKFDQAIRDAIVSRFGSVEAATIAAQQAISDIGAQYAKRINQLEGRIKELETQNANLLARAQAAEKERDEANNRTGMALLALTQEQATIKALLPAPKEKRSFFGLFGKKDK